MTCLLNLPRCILDTIPWYVTWGVILVIVLAAFYYLYRLFGWEKIKGYVLPVLIALGAGAALQRSRQQGYADRKSEEGKAADKARNEFDQIHKQDEGLSDADLDKKNDPWLKP